MRTRLSVRGSCAWPTGSESYRRPCQSIGRDRPPGRLLLPLPSRPSDEILAPTPPTISGLPPPNTLSLLHRFADGPAVRPYLLWENPVTCPIIGTPFSRLRIFRREWADMQDCYPLNKSILADPMSIGTATAKKDAHLQPYALFPLLLHPFHCRPDSRCVWPSSPARRPASRGPFTARGYSTDLGQ